MENQKYQPKKRLGQNFLRSSAALEKLVGSAMIGDKDIILEPGAGLGTVTKELAKKAKLVYAIEFDVDLLAQLQQTVPVNVEVLNKDALKLNWDDLSPAPTIVAGSIPYQITSPLIHLILYYLARHPHTIKRTALIIQKEVALKLCAMPPKATYLSNLVRLFGEPKIVKTIPPGSFFPAPKVNSAIWSLEIAEKTPNEKELREWETLLHKGFSHPRQMINKVFDSGWLKKIGVRPQARAGELLIKDWQLIYLNACDIFQQ